MESILCNQCGFANETNSKYCKNCGYELPKVIIELPVQKSETKTPSKSKLNYKSIIGIIIGVSVASVVSKYFTQSPSYDKAMMEAANQINKVCPFMVDQETRLDNAISLPGNLFEYNYTLVNVEKTSIDTIAAKAILEPTITNSVKTNPQMEIQRSHKTTLIYYYKDKSGQYLFSIIVKPEQYL